MGQMVKKWYLCVIINSPVGLDASTVNSNFLYYSSETVFVGDIVYDSGTAVGFQEAVASAYSSFFIFCFPLGFVVAGMRIGYTVFVSIRFGLLKNKEIKIK